MYHAAVIEKTVSDCETKLEEVRNKLSKLEWQRYSQEEVKG